MPHPISSPRPSQSRSLIPKLTPNLSRHLHRLAALHLRMMRDCSGDYGAQRPTGTGVLHTSLTTAESAELETMATSEEAEKRRRPPLRRPRHYDSYTAAVLTVVCLSVCLV